MNPTTKRVLDRLKQGPLPCAEYNGLTNNRAYLKVVVFKLREAGYEIATLRHRHPAGGTRFQRQGKPGYWELVREPA